MFTGVVKLAQIDDYIAPSQNCIQPKIMKKDAKEQKATVTLNDCLACSGCITSAQSILIEQMSISKFISFSKAEEQTYLIISPQSLLSLSKYYKMKVENFLTNLASFLNHHFKNVIKIFDLNLAIQICHQLIFQQFTSRFQSKNLPILCSQCPGWVCYSQKTLTQEVTKLMSEIKSPQQILGQLIKQKYGKQCKVVSIMPCYDKKLQAIRFETEDKLKQVDLTLATIQIVDLIKQTGGQESFITGYKEEISDKLWFNPNSQMEAETNVTFVRDQTSNGYIQFVLNRLGIKEYKCEEIKNSDFKQYNFEMGGQIYKMAKCYGFRNIQKIVQLVKKNKCPYLYVEVMACPGGCFGGGGQIRYEGIKNKQIISEFQQLLKQYPSIDGSNQLNLSDYSLKLEQTHVKYKPIQKSMTEAVMNW